MSEIKKNKTTGTEFFEIGKQKFDADKEGIFNMDLVDVKKIMINYKNAGSENEKIAKFILEELDRIHSIYSWIVTVYDDC